MITGETYPATKQGFIDLIKDANRKKAESVKLITIVKLDKTIAALYEEVPPTGNLVGY